MQYWYFYNNIFLSKNKVYIIAYGQIVLGSQKQFSFTDFTNFRKVYL